MTTMFESEVYQRENHTPWASISAPRLMKDFCLSASSDKENEVTLTVKYRHDVSSRFWWTLTWTDEKGEKRSIEAQTLDKCLWRAATLQLQIQRPEVKF